MRPNGVNFGSRVEISGCDGRYYAAGFMFADLHKIPEPLLKKYKALSATPNKTNGAIPVEEMLSHITGRIVAATKLLYVSSYGEDDEFYGVGPEPLVGEYAGVVFDHWAVGSERAGSYMWEPVVFDQHRLNAIEALFSPQKFSYCLLEYEPKDPEQLGVILAVVDSEAEIVAGLASLRTPLLEFVGDRWMGELRHLVCDYIKEHCMITEDQNPLLAISLQAAVPLHIMQIQARGGPTDEDIKYAQETSDLLGPYGDLLLFGGKPRKLEANAGKISCAELFNRTAKAIAILAFCPGGVSLFGSHWEATRTTEPETATKERPKPTLAKTPKARKAEPKIVRERL